MKKKTLGEVLKSQRETLALTQRELAAKLGVKPSHVAYLETNRRRPSLGLVSRIAEALGLDKEMLFLLAHPEARELLNAYRAPAPPRTRVNVWRDFAQDKALLKRYQVNQQELRVLSHVNLLGKIAAPRHYLFILNAIRQAVEDE
jgi:transcriptional regulator with XRE-family HTH domain